MHPTPTPATPTATPLPHNRSNRVTASVERLRTGGGSVVRKRLARPTGTPDPRDPWAGSEDPRHWNWWRREVEAYADDDLRARLREAGLDLPAAEVRLTDDGAELLLEDVPGRPGTAFDLEDHAALATALGRWQGRPTPRPGWASSGFLRAYSTTRECPWALLADDGAWAHPLVREHWPAGLRDGWQRLVAHREVLLRAVETAPRTLGHLDLWVSNVVRRPAGEVVLLDWSFVGDAAVGEDVGNHVPDAALDLFWPAARLEELDRTCTAAYVAGLRDVGWSGSADDVRLAVAASAVKYAWLLPRTLARAVDPEQVAYGRTVGAAELFSGRGACFAHLVRCADEALALLDRRG